MYSQEYLDLLKQAEELHKNKSAGYTGADNPDPWANFRQCERFGIPAYLGCAIRLSDKYIRLTNLLHDPNNDKVGERIEDTLMDLSAYALIMICLLREYNEGKSNSGTLPEIA